MPASKYGMVKLNPAKIANGTIVIPSPKIYFSQETSHYDNQYNWHKSHILNEL